MKVKLIYSTPNYHKLVETTARVCYQSWHKDDEKSHNFIKAIMSNGHISVASVGNMVFEVDTNTGEEDTNLLSDVLTMKEINTFLKFTQWQKDFNEVNGYKLSMNMLTFLDIYKERGNYIWCSDLLDLIISKLDKVPHLKWFYDKSVELPEIKNEYTAKGIPSLYEPIILDEDYTALKALGLTDYELGIHATITANFIVDRAASLQSWRHWSGGCELSQRYVERGNAVFRDLVDFDYPEVTAIINEHREQTMERYERILQTCADNEIRKGRAKEAARSILPNDITTQLIQCRPYRNWIHLFKLRDSNHAQREIQEDVIHLKRVLNEIGIPTDFDVK